jgi:hypothetical protein
MPDISQKHHLINSKAKKLLGMVRMPTHTKFRPFLCDFVLEGYHNNINNHRQEVKNYEKKNLAGES